VPNVANNSSHKTDRAFSDFIAKAICVARKDARIYYFKPQILGFGILIPAFVYLSFSIGREIPFSLLVPGLVGVVSLFGASSVVAISIPIEKQTQTHELLQSAPLSTLNIIFGKCLAGSAFGILLSLVTALGAVLVSAGTVVSPLLFVVAAMAGAFVFSAFGMTISAGAKDMPTANMVLTALRLPMIFISGVFIPTESLPAQLRIVSYLTPLTYVVNVLREATIGPSVLFTVDLVVLLIWFIIFQSIAVMVLARTTSV
jgi:ABC-2 type transport system permease protein